MKYYYKMYHDIRFNEDREIILKNRYNYESSIKTKLSIKPIDQSVVYELFYIPTNNSMNLVQDIIINDRELLDKYNVLPGVARRKFLIETLVDELQNTNELEGVESTKEEIANSTRSIINNKESKNLRLYSMINSYLQLTFNNLNPPKTVEDYRQIYDRITAGEIKEDELPDGLLFRKDRNYVYKNGKVIHRGVYPEEEIINKLNQLTEFMERDREDINDLIKVAIGHYYFGYIHPFYDGNGRTSRYISSIYLTKSLSMMSGLSLSRGCNINRSNYLKAFDLTNKVVSSGELNYFVDEFLNIIKTGQQDLLMNLNEKIELIDRANEKIKNDKSLENQDEYDILFIMIQDYYFNTSGDGITVKDLVELLNMTDVTIRKKLKILEEKDLIKRIKSNPLIYVLNRDYLEKS